MRLFPAQPPPNRLQISVRSCGNHTNTDVCVRHADCPCRLPIASRSCWFSLQQMRRLSASAEAVRFLPIREKTLEDRDGLGNRCAWNCSGLCNRCIDRYNGCLNRCGKKDLVRSHPDGCVRQALPTAEVRLWEEASASMSFSAMGWSDGGFGPVISSRSTMTFGSKSTDPTHC